MTRRRKPWTRTEAIADARRFSTVSDWRKASAGAYAAANKNGWYAACVAHMPNLRQSVAAVRKRNGGKVNGSEVRRRGLALVGDDVVGKAEIEEGAIENAHRLLGFFAERYPRGSQEYDPAIGREIPTGTPCEDGCPKKQLCSAAKLACLCFSNWCAGKGAIGEREPSRKRYLHLMSGKRGGCR